MVRGCISGINNEVKKHRHVVQHLFGSPLQTLGDHVLRSSSAQR